MFFSQGSWLGFNRVQGSFLRHKFPGLFQDSDWFFEGSKIHINLYTLKISMLIRLIAFRTLHICYKIIWFYQLGWWRKLATVNIFESWRFEHYVEFNRFPELSTTNDLFPGLSRFSRTHRNPVLISNHYPTKWDFARLSQAILETLPTCQQESLHVFFSLSILMSLSIDIFKRKIEILQGHLWKIASV